MSRPHKTGPRTNGVLEAFVVLVDSRFYFGMGSINQVKTAWSLAGAKLFLERKEAEAMAAAITAKKPSRVSVAVRTVRIVPPALEGAA